MHLPLLLLVAVSVWPEKHFSFTYANRPSSELISQWKREPGTFKVLVNRTERTTVFTDPATQLMARCVTVAYADFTATEWTLHLKNAGNADTPIIENIRPLDITFSVPAEQKLILHHNTGSPCTPTDYAPQETELAPGVSKTIATTGGRPTNSDLPCFNLATSGEKRGGTIFVIGWPGQWSATFARDDKGKVHITAGQELTHLKLHPGEEIRTPLVVTMNYEGDWIDGQNQFRRWMLAHNMPKVKPEITPCSSHQVLEMVHANEKIQLEFIDRYLEEKIPIDYWWMDAGWYVLPNGTWPNTGTWKVDPARFPHGIRAISDHAHAKGVKTILWFEPERVTPNTELYKKREWLLGKDGEQKLLNMGKSEARRWITDHISDLITSEALDLYRQDFNIDPLPYWRGDDEPDRQGITEIKYIEGYLAHLDELLARHPGLRIDTCASGGRRNDLETLRRATPNLRSDYILEPLGQQQHTYGISLWIPFHGAGVNSADPYIFQSQMCPHITPVYDMRDRKLDYDAIRKRIAEWQQTAPLYYADFYPLTAYSTSPGDWLAWQFHDPQKQKGFVQAFRRPQCENETIDLKLKRLNAKSTYTLQDVNSGRSWTLTGAELMNPGLKLSLTARPSAALIVYE